MKKSDKAVKLKPAKVTLKKQVKKKPVKSKLKKAVKTRSKKIIKKTAKLPAYMTNKAALKHYRFALKYIENDLNGIEAYLAVYGESYQLTNGREMTRKVAGTLAAKLLVNVGVQTHVKELIEEWLLEDKTNAKKILARYNRWADSDIGDYIDFTTVSDIDADGAVYERSVAKVTEMQSLTEHQRKNIKSITVSKDSIKVELVDKKGSNDQLAKIIGLDKGEEDKQSDIHIHFDKYDEQL